MQRIRRASIDLQKVSLMQILWSLYQNGYRTVTANQVADCLYPDAHKMNRNAQVFNQAAGVTGRMLRQCKAVYEVRNRQWEIIPERLNVEL